MERESFIFYRSFHEAIKCMNEKVQSQIYSAIADYALDGIEPTNLCKEAQGMFLLMRPLIDANNTKYQNGKKGGRPRKKTSPEDQDAPEKAPSETPGQPESPEKPFPSPPPYSKSFKEEVEDMKKDEAWIESLCMQSHLDKEELLKRLDAFPLHCNIECADKPHKSYGDAQRHFCSWMRIAYKSSEKSSKKQSKNETAQTDKLQKRRGADTSARSAEDYDGTL